MAEFSPFRWKKQWLAIRNYTPEECETLESCMHELKVNSKYYCSIFGVATIGFNFWQRQYVPRKFYAFSFSVAMLTGMIFAGVKTGWYFVEQLDQLG